jgi:hypothetical protein
MHLVHAREKWREVLQRRRGIKSLDWNFLELYVEEMKLRKPFS